jgi:hypothetical protein
VSKMARVERAGGMAQAVDHLPSKLEALNSNPRTVKTYGIENNFDYLRKFFICACICSHSNDSFDATLLLS